MRPFFYTILLLGVTAGAQAGGLTPIDLRKQVDVTSKIVELPTVSYDSVLQPSLTYPVVPVSVKTVERNNMVETKNVGLNTLNFPVTSFKTLPMTNFSAKRADIDQTAIDLSGVPKPNAKINKRVIRALTPAGAKELQDQINKIP